MNLATVGREVQITSRPNTTYTYLVTLMTWPCRKNDEPEEDSSTDLHSVSPVYSTSCMVLGAFPHPGKAVSFIITPSISHLH